MALLRRIFAEAFDGLNRKGSFEMFASAFSDELVWAAIPDGAVRRGLASLVYIFEADLEYGVRMAITNILASKDVIVIEGDQVNPPEDPFHCPPAISMVGFYRGGRINLLHTYEPPRPEKQHDLGWSLGNPAFEKRRATRREQTGQWPGHQTP